MFANQQRQEWYLLCNFEYHFHLAWPYLCLVDIDENYPLGGELLPIWITQGKTKGYT